MSSYLKTLTKYKNDYKISFWEFLKMVLHYPFFKLLWLARYGEGVRKNVAQRLVPMFKGYALPISIPFDNLKINFNLELKTDSVASFKEIFWGGEYHFKNKISQVITMVDLGANTGMATVELILRFHPKRLLCVEGNQEIAIKLQNIQNQVNRKCDFMIENKCVTGNYNGPVTFIVSDDHRNSRIVYGEENGGEKCKGASLRKLLDDHNLMSVDLLKIDIEGGEYDILENDGEIFKRFRDIFIEIHGDNNKRDEFRNGLIQLGFDLMEKKLSIGYDNCEVSHFRRK